MKANTKGYTIRQELHAGQVNPSWRVDVNYHGVHLRRRFKLKTDAEGWGQARVAELKHEGTEGEALNRDEKIDAAAAFKTLGADGGTLAEAARELQECRQIIGVVDADGKPTDGRTGAQIRDLVKDAVSEWAEAWKELDGRATISQAVAFWKERNPDGNAVKMGEALNLFMVEAERTGEHSYTVRLQSRLGALVEWLGRGDEKRGRECAVGSIDAREMERFLDWHAKQCAVGRVGDWKKRLAATPPKPLRPVPFTTATRNKWVVTFKHFFGWATDKYDLPINPAAKLKTQKRGLKERKGSIDFLQADAAEKILRAAEKVAPEFVPAVAIAFLAGLRPFELVGKYESNGAAVPGLDWSRIDRNGSIVVEGETTKMRQRRTVPMEDNLKAWIAAYAPTVREGPVVPNPTAWRRARAAIVKEAGVAWGQDVARHCYATMHYGKYADRARLEANLGHTDGSGVLENHYKDQVSKAEAKRFWAIMPTSSRKAVRKGGAK